MEKIKNNYYLIFVVSAIFFAVNVGLWSNEQYTGAWRFIGHLKETLFLLIRLRSLSVFYAGSNKVSYAKWDSDFRFIF